jgi:hypothetical protein
MQAAEARQIIENLANGVDPETGNLSELGKYVVTQDSSSPTLTPSATAIFWILSSEMFRRPDST